MTASRPTFFQRARRKLATRTPSYAGRPISNRERRAFRSQAERELAAVPEASGPSLRTLFGDVSDLQWYWLLTEGRRQLPDLARRLPFLPSEELQAQYTGLSGDAGIEQALRAACLFRSTSREYGLSLNRAGAQLLDFGCGWGRVTQMFLRDFDPDCITGADVSEETLGICRETKIGCSLVKVEPTPPIDLPDESIDLVSAYSVFSHLSEEAQWAWVEELHRVLRPGGVLTVTTRPREFIDQCVALRAQDDIPDFARGAASSFIDSAAAYARYDAGEFCFDVLGGGGEGRSGYYGEALIPREYVERHWSKLFSSVGFVSHLEHGCFDQNLLSACK
jgi:SAM-dependent methyltransferase